MNTPVQDQAVDTMPCDPDLLFELGRVTWAAARLHAGIRDAINSHRGTPSNTPFGITLGKAVSELEDLAEKAGRGDQATWATDVGRPAVKVRNLIVHAITYTAGDGRQAIRTSDHSPPGRLLGQDLREVTFRLLEAHQTLPK